MWNGVREGYAPFPHDINERWVMDFGLPLPRHAGRRTSTRSGRSTMSSALLSSVQTRELPSPWGA
jgi:hypothetical protein